MDSEVLEGEVEVADGRKKEGGEVRRDGAILVHGWAHSFLFNFLA